jgi:pimeloyl-ACP methyl ester carboxylesterase
MRIVNRPWRGIRTGARIEESMNVGRNRRRSGAGGFWLIAAGAAIAVTFKLGFATLIASTPTAHATSDTSDLNVFVQVGQMRQLEGAPVVFEWSHIARRGASPFDRIGLHRIAPGPIAATHPQMVVLYLPGTNMNGEIAIANARYSLPVYLASRGADVWTLDYRTHFIPPETPPDKLTELQGWTDRVFVDDVKTAADFVATRTHRAKLFVAGFSRGAEFGYLFAALDPGRVAGLVILDGFIPSRPARAPPLKHFADDIGGRHLTYDKRKALMEAVIRNPDGPAPLPKYKSASDNLSHVVYDADGVFGGHGGLANPLGGFSDPAVLARVLAGYDRWWPAVQDYENPFDAQMLARLKITKIPVIAFASTNISRGWPDQVAGSAQATGSADVTVKRLAGWGHLDVICGTHAEDGVYAPLLDWLKRHQK